MSISFVMHKKVVNIPFLFFGVWLFILILYQLKLSYHQNSLSNVTLLYLSYIFSAFFIGYFYVFTFYLPKYKKYGVKKNTFENFKVVYSKKFVTFSFWIIITLLLMEGIYSGGFPLFWYLQGAPKNYFDFGIPTFHGILMSYILFYGTLLYVYIKKAQGYLTKKMKIYFFIIIFILLILITRQNLVILFVQIAFAHHFMIKKINFVKLIPIGLIFIILFGVIGNFRTGLSEFVTISEFKNPNISPLLSGFYWVYMYFTMTVANLDNLFNMHFEYSYGLNMLQSFLPTVLLDAIYGDAYTTRFWLVHPNYTVSGYMASPYLDFGIIGVSIYSGIIGAIGCIIYHEYYFRKNFSNTFIYILFLQIIIMTFFTDYLLYLPVSFQIFWSITLLRSKR